MISHKFPWVNYPIFYLTSEQQRSESELIKLIFLKKNNSTKRANQNHQIQAAEMLVIFELSKMSCLAFDNSLKGS